MMSKRWKVTLGLILTVVIIAACGGGKGPGSDGTSSPTESNNSASLNKDSYPVFPDADSGADPAVPADKGGKGFTGEGWQTNTSYDLIGDPRAVKGGLFRQAMTDFPTTLRYYGPNVTAWNAMVHSMVYETLLGLHPTSLEYIPAVASHWQISADKTTFRFRIDPNARFSDGTPVTSEDVVASWKLVVDEGLQDPARMVVYSKFDQPVAESKYIVSVHTKTESWQNFLYFAQGLFVYPAHVLKSLSAKTYIETYQDKMLPGTGPYIIAKEDVDKGKSIKIRRRKDYWGIQQRRNIGISNFDEIQQIVVRDRGLEFEMFKKGDLDSYTVNRASMWVQELDFDNIKRGLIQKRKIFNHNPQGVQGIAINTRREPFTDIRVRKAIRHLFNRESLISSIMFNEYVISDSTYFGSVNENPNNEKVRYDPQKAVQLLAEAGWKDRDSSGRLMKNGRPLTFEVVYADKASSERILTPFQEDLRKVGITLDLRLVTFETLIKLLDERTFDLCAIAYTGELFPGPEGNLLSKLADQKNTNNITGFKNKRADEIIDLYLKEFDLQKRVKLLRELDGIVTSEHHWILEWAAPFERVIYWNKFGQPPGILTRTGDTRDVPSLWWIDADKEKKLQQAMKDTSMQLGAGASENKYWLDFSKVEEQKNSVNQ
jgi:microcin C transport system substrate-binding protein